MLNWKEATQRTYLLGGRLRFPRTEAQETGSEATHHRKSPRSRSFVSPMLTLFISKLNAHATTSIAAAPLLSYIIRPSIVLPLSSSSSSLSLSSSSSSFLWTFFLGVGHFVVPVVVLVAAAFFSPAHRSYLTTESWADWAWISGTRRRSERRGEERDDYLLRVAWIAHASIWEHACDGLYERVFEPAYARKVNKFFFAS